MPGILGVVRAVGGIMGRGAKNVNPIYQEIGTGSVTKIPQITKFQQKTVNELRTSIANERKSGGFAKNAATQMQGYYKALGGPKKTTVKINSGNMRAR